MPYNFKLFIFITVIIIIILILSFKLIKTDTRQPSVEAKDRIKKGPRPASQNVVQNTCCGAEYLFYELLIDIVCLQKNKKIKISWETFV